MREATAAAASALAPAAGHPRAAARPLAPPVPRPLPALNLKQRSQLRVDFCAFVVTIAGHLAHWSMLLHMADTTWQRAQPVLPLAAMVLGAVVVQRMPRYYMRHRNWLLPVLRLLVVLPPSARTMRVGSALILERPPHPGWRGAARDAFTLLPGTRTLVGLMQGSVNALPPTVALLTQAAMMWLTSNASGYCTTQMLAAPLTQQRMGAAAAALEYASLPLVALQPISGQLALAPAGEVMAGRAQPEPLCRCAITFYMAFTGVLVPAFISAWGWQPPSAPPAPRGSGGTGEQQPSLLQRLARLGTRALTASDQLLHALADCSSLPGGRMLSFWFVACFTWLICRLALGLEP